MSETVCTACGGGAIEFWVQTPEAGRKLGPFLQGRGISLSTIRALKFREMGLSVNGVRCRTCDGLKAGDRVLLHLPAEERYSAQPQQLPLDVLYEDAEAMVINKPAGQVMHPDPSHREGTLANAYCGYMQRCGKGGVFRPVGRLDGDTSGLVLCAANVAVVPMLQNTLQKCYVALVQGKLRGSGRIDAPILAAEEGSVVQRVDACGRSSVTEYATLATGEALSLVAARPLTGRTHQIRVHFAHIGYPLAGDALYGGTLRWMQRHALHCARMSFCGLAGRRVGFEAPLPQDMVNVAQECDLDITQIAGINKLFT